MKKVHALLFLATISAVTVHAQDDSRSFRFGLKVAPNLGFVKTDTKGLKSDGSQLGFSFGLLGDFNVGGDRSYAFSTGLLLNNVVGKTTYPIDDVNLGRTTKFQYVELPVTLKLMTNEIGYITYYGQIGFGAAFNIAAKSDFDLYDSATKSVTRKTDEDVMDHTNPFKASLILGAGLHYNFSGNTALLVGITYNNGFTNILKDVKVGDTELKAKQNYLELTLGMFF